MHGVLMWYIRDFTRRDTAPKYYKGIPLYRTHIIRTFICIGHMRRCIGCPEMRAFALHALAVKLMRPLQNTPYILMLQLVENVFFSKSTPFLPFDKIAQNSPNKIPSWLAQFYYGKTNWYCFMPRIHFLMGIAVIEQLMQLFYEIRIHINIEGFSDIMHLSLFIRHPFMKLFTGKMIHHILCELPFDATLSPKILKKYI